MALSAGKCRFSEVRERYSHYDVERFRPRKEAKVLDSRCVMATGAQRLATFKAGEMMDNERKLIRNSTAEFLIVTTQSGDQSIEARYADETVWLTQRLMAEHFAVDVRTVNEHLKNVFGSGELSDEAVIQKFRITAADGKRYLTQLYNLDAIISVGYRVNSVRATQFRQWATEVLREFAIKGHLLDRKRLENGAFLGEDYFERLLAEIREIRLSERRFYQKITDIYTTAVELIARRAGSSAPHMGLISWERARSR